MNIVLIAEDDPVSSAVIKDVVIKQGATPVSVGNGETAFEVLTSNSDQVKLLVTDCIMPRLDGRQLVREIRECKDLETLPVIIISGHVSLQEIGNVLECGASRFLPKPINRGMLSEYVEYFLYKGVSQK